MGGFKLMRSMLWNQNFWSYLMWWHHMADWGLNIDDILPPGVLLNVASMLNETGQLTAKSRPLLDELFHSAFMLNVRWNGSRITIYYTVFQTVCTTIQVFFVCAVLTNFLNPLMNISWIYVIMRYNNKSVDKTNSTN